MEGSSASHVLDIGLTPRKKVLVVEDEEHIASLVEDWLSDTFEVITAYNGKAALQKARWNAPDVILMDIMMPDMGGFEVVRALQGEPQTKDLPVIAMTAKNFDDSTVRLIKGEANVMGFINKPFEQADLRAKIDEVLAGRRTFEPPAPAAAPRTAAPRTTADAVPGRGSVDAPEEPSRGGRRAAAAAAALATLVLVAGIVEWSARRGPLPEDAAAFARALRPSRRPGLPFELPPRAVWTADGMTYRLDSWGLRDGEIPLQPDPGARRVYLLGGAGLFGRGVADGQTAADVLEAGLNASGGRWDVVNGAAWAHSPAEQWARFEDAGAQFQPALVLWFAEGRPEDAPRPGALRAWWKVPSALRPLLARSALVRRSLGRPGAAADGGGDSATLWEAAKRAAERDGFRVVYFPVGLTGRPEDSAGGSGETLRRLDEEVARRFPRTVGDASGHRWLAENLVQWVRLWTEPTEAP
jgi:CheY-like chemotaxis protein